MDRPEFPLPAVRFGENTKEVLALREKEKGDWKNLSLDEKKKCNYLIMSSFNISPICELSSWNSFFSTFSQLILEHSLFLKC